MTDWFLFFPFLGHKAVSLADLQAAAERGEVSSRVIEDKTKSYLELKDELEQMLKVKNKKK